MRDIRTRKAVCSIYKFFYYCITILGGWYVLKDSFLLPPSLFGVGDFHYTFKDFPFPERPQYYQIYFTGSMGYHLSALIQLVFTSEKKSDYIDLLLHHLVTIYLYGFSYLTNTMIGGIIAHLHNCGDIFIAFTRVLSESEYKGCTAASFSFALVVYLYTRLLVLSQCIYIVIFKLHFYAACPYLKPMFGAMLSCLLVLHCYWFFYSCKILSNYFTKGIAEDSINDSTSLKNVQTIDGNSGSSENETKRLKV